MMARAFYVYLLLCLFELLFLFELFCFLFHHILNVDGIEWNGTTTQLWDVETLQAIVVEGWLLLRQDERLVSLAMLIKIAEVRLAVESVIAFACKDKPSA